MWVIYFKNMQVIESIIYECTINLSSVKIARQHEECSIFDYFQKLTSRHKNPC